jgi:maleylpyruvate isomerase
MGDHAAAGGAVVLHGFFRSSASYRVRIALNIKGVRYDSVAHHLRHQEQRDLEYLAINPQGLVPTLIMGGEVLTQSLAICEYLDEVFADPPLLPTHPLARARVRAAAQVIACDVHPIQNLKILDRLRANGLDEEAVNAWPRQTIDEGLDAFATLLPETAGPFCFGDSVSLADICLIPQLANARRFGITMRWPRIERIESACLALEAFRKALPDNQPDAE